MQDTTLEAQLPNVEVTERALAINALLSALKLQVGWLVGWLAGHWHIAREGEHSLACMAGLPCIAYVCSTEQGSAGFALPIMSIFQLPPCTPTVPARPACVQILVNPADPSSHIYKANAQGDTARCALAAGPPLLMAG